MSFFQNQRNLITIFVLLLFLPIIFALFSFKQLRFWEKPKTVSPTPPVKQVKIMVPSPSPVIFNKGKDIYICPTNADFCKNGKDILLNNQYLGFGTTVTKGLPIFAVFDGELTSLKANLTGVKDKVITIIYLTNEKTGLTATYLINGDAKLQPKTVKSGAIIATVGNKFADFNASLIFKLSKGNPVSGEAVKLTSSDFK